MAGQNRERKMFFFNTVGGGFVGVEWKHACTSASFSSQLPALVNQPRKQSHSKLRWGAVSYHTGINDLALSWPAPFQESQHNPKCTHETSSSKVCHQIQWSVGFLWATAQHGQQPYYRQRGTGTSWELKNRWIITLTVIFKSQFKVS